MCRAAALLAMVGQASDRIAPDMTMLRESSARKLKRNALT